jgi:hypothetical protein
MKELLSGGKIVDLALAVILLEFIALLVMARRDTRGLRVLDLAGQLLAGVMLLLAVRCALTRADERWTILFLSASFPAHVFDLVRRRRSVR